MVDLWEQKMTMTNAQAFIVLEVVEGETTDEINQAYKKGVPFQSTILVNILATTISRLLISLKSQANCFSNLVAVSSRLFFVITICRLVLLLQSILWATPRFKFTSDTFFGPLVRRFFDPPSHLLF